MTVDVPVSATYTLRVEHSTFANGAPCISLAMYFTGEGEPQRRGYMRFDRRSLRAVIEAVEMVSQG